MKKIDILHKRHEYEFTPALSVHAVEPVWIKTIQHVEYLGWVLKKFSAVRWPPETDDDSGMVEILFYGKSPDGRWFKSITQITGAMWDDEEMPFGKIIKDLIFESVGVFLNAEKDD